MGIEITNRPCPWNGAVAKPKVLTATIPVERSDNWNDENRDGLRIVCLEGHSYYYFFTDRMDHSEEYAIFAPKLDDEGHPVKCGPVLEKTK